MVKTVRGIENKKQLILEASIKMIVSHQGIIRTKLLADEIGISEATIFRYFETKDILCETLIHYVLGRFRNYFKKAGLLSSRKGDDSVHFDIPSSRRLRILWDIYFDWGLEYALDFQALRFFSEANKFIQSFIDEELSFLCPCEMFLSSEGEKGFQAFWHFKLASRLFIAIADATLAMAVKMSDQYDVRQLREMSFISLFHGLSPYVRFYISEEEKVI